MAKVVHTTDMSMMPTNGKWVWKEEGDKGVLEYVSNNPSDKHDKRKDRRQQKGAVHFPDHRGRSSPSQMGRGPFAVGGRAKMGLRGMPGQRAVSGKQQQTHTNVTIEHIKEVACDMTGYDNFAETFDGLYKTKQFDHFLLCLLNYFHWYFEKKAQEEKPNPMNNEPSRREREYYADLCNKLEVAQKVLGQAYCILILGIGIDDQHHMACGSSRVSNTYKDRSMYETLYTFCTYVVWIAFRRQKEYEVVKKELNRALRSQTFNPAIRIKNAPDPEPKEGAAGEEADEDKKPKKPEVKLTPAEYRRQQGRRPPIKSIINQRSPALVSILPSPKEEANWLFKSQGKDAMAIPRRIPRKKTLSEKDREDIAEEDASKYAHLDIDITKLKVGIIGEPLCNFNPITLTPKGAETEGEEEEGANSNKDGRRNSVAPKTAGSQERRMSREATGVSQITQEGIPDDE